jgi:hypothetical protein
VEQKLGSMERRALDWLGGRADAGVTGSWTGRDVARGLHGPTGKLPASVRVSVLRALRSLLAKGLVVQDRDVRPGGITIRWARAVKIEAAKAKDARRKKRRRQEARWQRTVEGHRARRATKDDGFTDAREKLVRVLGMLGSAHDREALSAARQAVAIVKRLGVQWHELLVEREPDSRSVARLEEQLRNGAATGV